MKKIININLSGRVVPIEDSAYDKLQAYMESLRRYFANEESREEIINDIESRIAELLHEKIRKGATAVTDADVNEVIASMGTVEDFEAEEKLSNEASQQSSQQGSNQQQYTYTEKKTRGRLYRDSNDKFIGGVCSGIASYLNVDPSVVRLLFGVLAFGTGVGFLAYIILWIVLPPKDLEGFRGKRLYRNPDNRMLGGVAGGLGAYFDKRPNNIRLIFVAPILLHILFRIIAGFSWDNDFDLAWNIGFGSLTGTFALTYIILWIVLPEANSDYEKMEMRGEKVDVNRIRQNVKEGMGNMKDRMKSWGEEVKESAQNIGNRAKEFAGTRGREFASDVNETVRRRSGGIGHAIAVLFKVFFLFIGGIIAFSLFVGLIALLFSGFAWSPVNNFLWTSKPQQVYAWGTLIFFLVVPLIAFITWIIRRIMKARSRNNYLGWTFGGLWTIGWIFMVLFASSMVKDFRDYEDSSLPISITQPAHGRMIVAVTQEELEYSGGFRWMRRNGNDGWDLSKDTLKIAAVQFNVHASIDSQYHVTLKKYSFGRSPQEARNRAEGIQYEIRSTDSILDLSNGYAIDSKSKFRGQHIEIEILVPVGKKLRFDQSIEDKLNSLHIHVRRDGRRNRVTGFEINNNEEDEWYKTNVDYVMGPNDKLIDPNMPVQSATPVNNGNDNNNYRYDQHDTVTKTAEQKAIEEEKRKMEESRRKIKELEDQEKAKEKRTSNVLDKKALKKTNEAYAASPAPISSLVEWF